MSDKTGIEWTDSTWNPVRGCSRVSQGCVNCYAEKVAARFSGPGQPYAGLINKHGTWNGEIRFVDKALTQPLRWRRPRRIFVNSMSDLFHENVTYDQIDRIFAVMALSPQHTFQILTKRPERMLAWATHGDDGRWGYVDGRARQIWRAHSGKEFPAGKMLPFQPLPNVWLGVSVENQETADERIPLLLQIPAAVRFLSCEPLLGHLDLTSPDWLTACECGHIKMAHTGEDERGACHCPTAWENRNALKPTAHCQCGSYRQKLHWVIVGGESGHGSRPMHPEWVRSIRNQCRTAGVAFFFKQWGEYLPGGQDGNPDHEPQELNASTVAIKVGKKRAGRLLDGREHSEYPS